MGITATRRDQLEGYRFLRKRALSAFLTGRVSQEDQSSSRVNKALISGVFLAILVLAVFGILGIVRPSAPKGWDKAGSVVLERGSGARYVVLDGKLHPVLNTASARLIAGNDKVSEVDSSALANKARGLPVGIPGAPDNLPAVDRLVGAGWSACARRSASGDPQTTLLVGTDPGGKALPADRGVLVRGPDHRTYLAAAGHRYLVHDTRVAQALGWFDVDPVAVPASWLDVLLPGADLTFPTVDKRGSASVVRLDGAVQRVGKVVLVRAMSGPTQEYVVLADGLAPVPQTTALLLLGDPAAASLYGGRRPEPVKATPAQLNSVPTSHASLDRPGLPPTAPSLTTLPATAYLCVVHGRTAQTLRVVRALPEPVAAAVVARPRQSAAAADQVYVPEGGGAVVSSGPGTAAVVTDSGQRFQVSGSPAKVLAALGYGKVHPNSLPAAWLALLGDGPALAAEQARRLWTVLPSGQNPGTSVAGTSGS